MNLNSIRRRNEEEYWNILTHAIGIPVSGGVMFYMLITIQPNLDGKLLAILLMGLSSMLVYITSTIYHYYWDKPYRPRLRTIDHISIYFLIAGTYTPFLIFVFQDETSGQLLRLIWGLAIIGTLYKLFYTGKFENLSLAFYILMGCSIFVEYDTFVHNTPDDTLGLVTIGGALYLIGVVFYRWKSLKFNHAVWHIFVLMANLFHFAAVYTLIN